MLERSDMMARAASFKSGYYLELYELICSIVFTRWWDCAAMHEGAQVKDQRDNLIPANIIGLDIGRKKNPA